MSGNLSPDHVHMLISLPPHLSVSRGAQCVKGKLAESCKKNLRHIDTFYERMLTCGCLQEAVGAKRDLAFAIFVNTFIKNFLLPFFFARGGVFSLKNLAPPVIPNVLHME